MFAQPPARITLKHLCGHVLGASAAAEVALLTATLDAGLWPSQAQPQCNDGCAAAGDALVETSAYAMPAQLSAQPPKQLRHVLALFLGFGGGHAVWVLEDTLAGAGPNPLRSESPRVCVQRPRPLQMAAAAQADGAVQARAGKAGRGWLQSVPDLRWQVSGRSALRLPPDWREALAVRLGERPRRLGAWAELALFGARACLDAASERQLPAGALLRLASLIGPTTTVLRALDDMRDGTPPLPYTFLQSQPAVAMAAIAAQLEWSGDAVLLNCREPVEQLRAALAAAQAAEPAAGLLLGWVEEAPEPYSCWLRLVPSSAVAGVHWPPMRVAEAMSPRVRHLALRGSMLICAEDERAEDEGAEDEGANSA